MRIDNFSFYFQNRLIQTSQTGQQYSDTSPFSIPCWHIFLLGWEDGPFWPLRQWRRKKFCRNIPAKDDLGEGNANVDDILPLPNVDSATLQKLIHWVKDKDSFQVFIQFNILTTLYFLGSFWIGPME